MNKRLFCFFSYPLTKVPLPGNAPLEYATPVQTFLEQRQMISLGKGFEKTSTDQKAPPRWVSILFIKHIIGYCYRYYSQLRYKVAIVKDKLRI